MLARAKKLGFLFPLYDIRCGDGLSARRGVVMDAVYTLIYIMNISLGRCI